MIDTPRTVSDTDLNGNGHRTWLFWTCFIALTATSFGFMGRVLVIGEWSVAFNLNETEKGSILGALMWPFGISIFFCSLIIDKVGYGRILIFAFFCHTTSVITTICASLALASTGASPDEIASGQKAGYWLLYAGTVLMALGNGTVEAVINPAVATIYHDSKSKWLNILHAGWPSGLVVSGIVALAMNPGGLIAGMSGELISWHWKIILILVPTLVYGFMLFRCRFPVNERVKAGVSYRVMLQEIGLLGAVIVAGLMVRQLGTEFKWSGYFQITLGAALVFIFGWYVRSIGKWMFAFLLLIMIVSGTTEVSTDAWIKELMQPEIEKLWGLGLDAGWVLVYTASIMMILRFCAGPLVKKFSPLGVLAISSAIAVLGLMFMSKATGSMILLAATVYGVGQTFFWPMMLGVVADRFPRGGAMTLNTVAAVGVLGIGVFGTPWMGYIQDTHNSHALKEKDPQLYAQVQGEQKQSVFGSYPSLDNNKIEKLPAEQKGAVDRIRAQAKKNAMFSVAALPAFLFICYLALVVYFRARGGYRPVDLESHADSSGATML